MASRSAAPALEIAPADPFAPDSLRLAAALWAELSTIYPEMTAPPFPPRDIVGDRAVLMVASLGEKLIGCGAIRPFPLPAGVAAAVSAADAESEITRSLPAGDTPATTIAEIKRMYVAPEARGRGVAAAILRALEAWAVARGYVTVRLETGGRQPFAVQLYERFGYHRITPYGHHVDDPLARCFEKSLR